MVEKNSRLKHPPMKSTEGPNGPLWYFDIEADAGFASAFYVSRISGEASRKIDSGRWWKRLLG